MFLKRCSFSGNGRSFVQKRERDINIPAAISEKTSTRASPNIYEEEIVVMCSRLAAIKVFHKIRQKERDVVRRLHSRLIVMRALLLTRALAFLFTHTGGASERACKCPSRANPNCPSRRFNPHCQNNNKGKKKEELPPAFSR